MNKKKIIRRTIEGFLLISVIIAFVLGNEAITDKRRSSFRVVEDNNTYAYQVESISNTGKDLIIRGWFFEIKKIKNIERETSENGNVGIIIYDISTENGINQSESTVLKRGIKAETTYEIRQDINAYFGGEYDYSKCGFVSRVESSLLDLEKGKYQIVLKQDEDKDSGIIVAYIINGRLKYMDSNEEPKLNVANTDLVPIVGEGTCLMSYPEFHICIYQYGWKLYWIADSDYSFDDTGNTFIQLQMDTTQFDKLPKERIDKGLFWSDIGATFESGEITNEMNCGEYRVCVKDLPTEYSVTYLVTGSYVDGQSLVWRKFFRLDYLQR